MTERTEDMDTPRRAYVHQAQAVEDEREFHPMLDSAPVRHCPKCGVLVEGKGRYCPVCAIVMRHRKGGKRV